MNTMAVISAMDYLGKQDGYMISKRKEHCKVLNQRQTRKATVIDYCTCCGNESVVKAEILITEWVPVAEYNFYENTFWEELT